MLDIPYDGIGVEVFGWIEPEMELLLSVSFALCEDIGVEGVRFTRWVSQKLEVDFVVGRPLRR